MDYPLNHPLNQAELLAVAKKELARRSKIAAGRTGKQHSEETKQKMKDAWTRRKSNTQKSKGVSAKTGLEETQ